MVLRKKIKMFVVFALIAVLLTVSSGNTLLAAPEAPIPAPTLNPLTIQKYVNQLVIPPVYEPEVITDSTGNIISHNYTIDASQFEQQILPTGFPMTTVWGYGGKVKDSVSGQIVDFKNAPGATIEAVRGIPVNVQWVNNLTGPHLFAVDPTLHWANPNMVDMDPPKPWPAFPMEFSDAQNNVPIAPHLHGGEVQSDSDGGPDAWFTAAGDTGPTYTQSKYHYPNKQEAATLWYHDHALGITRINVYSGLAGFYLLRDCDDPLENPTTPDQPVLPVGKYDIPLAIQDRSFNTDGSFFFPSVGINPAMHPYWNPEFFGDTIMVNGKVWPNLDVERRQYRFRVLNGSNARFYNLQLSNKQSFIQIGSDGGYLPAPVILTSLLLAPGERADILIDFSTVAPGTSIILTNDAKAPYPNGAPADPKTVGQIMQFTVPANAAPAVVPLALPAVLRTMPELTPDAPARTLTLNEIMGAAGPCEILLNGQKYTAAISELPQVGSTEDWEIVNLTADTHPIHLHLVQFQLISRQAIQTKKYLTDWTILNGMPPLAKDRDTISVPVAPYLQSKPVLPAANEIGWKDTIQVNPGEVTRIRIRFAPQDADPDLVEPGVNLFPFDPTTGPGYVWHCHIIDHEDNEMMRPYQVTN